MFHFRSRWVAGILLCFAHGIAANTLEKVVVHGKAYDRSTLADVNLETYSGFETVIERESFENQLVDMGDVINQSISAQIRKTGGMGSYSSASIRGSTGKQINLYVDGMLLTNPQSGYSNLSVIPTSIIDRIEIYPDFTPGQLGDANIGGALNIRTRQPEQSFGGRAALSFGSFNTQQLALDLWGGNSQTDAIVAATTSQSDNDYPMDLSVCEAVQMTCGTSRHRLTAAYKNYSILAKVRHRINQQFTLQTLIASSESDNEVPSQNNRSSHFAELKNALHQFNVMLQSDQQRLSWGVRFYGNQQQEDFTNPTVGSLILGGSDVTQTLDNLGGNIFAEYRIAKHSLGAALDYVESRAVTDDNKRKLSLEANRQKISLALSDHWQALDWLALTAVLRSNIYDDQTQTPPINTGTSAHCHGNQEDCANYQQTHHSWQLGFAVTPGNWTIKGNVGEMIRMPTLTERFGQTGAFVGDANLKHEESQNVDLGVLYQNSLIETQIALFHKDLINGIYIVYDARGVGKPFNVAKANIHGIEGLFRIRAGQYISLHAGGQWMDSNNQSQIKAHYAKKLNGIYHQSYQAGLTLQKAQHLWSLTYFHDDDMFFDSGNRIPAPPRKVWNTSYSWSYQALTLNFSVNNLLDDRYVDFNFMPAVGRSYSTTVSFYF